MVATVAEIPPGGRKIVEIEGRSIGVFNVGGEFFALRNRCPHQGAPLCTGQTVGFLEASKPGEYTYGRAGEILRCPWHLWEFDLRTGRSWCDPTQVRVKRYDVSVESESAPDEGCATEPPTGTLTVETYPARDEAGMVVINI